VPLGAAASRRPPLAARCTDNRRDVPVVMAGMTIGLDSDVDAVKVRTRLDSNDTSAGRGCRSPTGQRRFFWTIEKLDAVRWIVCVAWHAQTICAVSSRA
jgi:hypothetical protein